jgi:hypothetical protein
MFSASSPSRSVVPVGPVGPVGPACLAFLLPCSGRSALVLLCPCLRSLCRPVGGCLFVVVGETRGVFWRGVRAGVVGGVVGGVPSTVWALVRRGDPLAAALAAGRILLPEEGRRGWLLLAALPVHFGVSAGWGVVLARVLPARGTVLWGAVAGGVVAGVALSVPGRRTGAVRELSVLPQVVDHVVYGAVVGIYLRRRALRLR